MRPTVNTLRGFAFKNYPAGKWTKVAVEMRFFCRGASVRRRPVRAQSKHYAQDKPLPMHTSLNLRKCWPNYWPLREKPLNLISTKSQNELLLYSPGESIFCFFFQDARQSLNIRNYSRARQWRNTFYASWRVLTITLGKAISSGGRVDLVDSR